MVFNSRMCSSPAWGALIRPGTRVLPCVTFSEVLNHGPLSDGLQRCLNSGSGPPGGRALGSRETNLCTLGDSPDRNLCCRAGLRLREA